MKIRLEIRPGEGGEDARLLVAKQAGIYIKYAEIHGIEVQMQDQSVG